MAKVKITPKMLKDNRLIQKEIQRNTELNFKSIAKVFKEFGEETESQLAKSISMQDLKWNVLKGRLETVLSTNSKRSINNFTKFLNKLFNYNLTDTKIEKVKNKTVDKYAKGLAQKVTYVTETTKQQIANLIDNNKGLNTNDLAKLINEKFTEMSLGRSKTIARTESAHLFANSSKITADEVGMKYKTYIHGVSSPNERPNHKALDGVKIPIDELFDFGDEQADIPHDSSLSAGNCVNCSCTVFFSNR